MRGTGAPSVPPSNGNRFIPAYAGNRSRTLAPIESPPVHPRVCGEQQRAPRPITSYCGSSPRMRGTGERPVAVRRRFRFIPAYAGNRRVAFGTWQHRSVHPRVCGEQAKGAEADNVVLGSSPRMRGTVTPDRFECRKPRFIPAYAGNRRTRRLRFLYPPVHPRVCGEQASCRSNHCSKTGSSPRMRGTAMTRRLKRSRPRFIPAYAGNSRRRCPRCLGPTVHPRVCGEQLSLSRAMAAAVGSSPRMRGTVTATISRACMRRFIPAYAGNSLPVAC